MKRSRPGKIVGPPEASDLSPRQIELLREDCRLSLEFMRRLTRLRDAEKTGAAEEAERLRAEIEDLQKERARNSAESELEKWRDAPRALRSQEKGESWGEL
jgi:hypothetical protein